MNRRKKHKRRIPNPVKTPPVPPEKMNLTWSMDFMENRLENGRKVGVLNIIDEFNREASIMEMNYSFTSNRVMEIVKQSIEWRAKPKGLRTDNGTEVTAFVFEQYCRDNEIDLFHIQKGKPMQNGYVERFNRSYREAVLDAFIVENLNQDK